MRVCYLILQYKIMDKYDKALYYEIFTNKEYAVLDKILKNAETIFDVGWYKWYFSMYAFGINPDLKVHFFEPIPSFFDQSRQNLINFDSQIFWNNTAIRASSWVSTAYIEKTKWMQSSFFYDNFMLSNTEEIEVNSTSLDDYFLTHFVNIQLLKLDIEGSEFEVLANFHDFDKVESLFLEYHLIDRYTPKDLQNLLDNLSKNYKNIQRWDNKYTDKLGYILCTR